MSGSTTVYYLIAASTGEVMQYGTTTADQWAAIQQSASATQIEQGQYNQLLSGGRWIYQPASKTLTQIPASAPALAQAQAAASATIDVQAEQCRRLFITPGSGQAMVYIMKANQAQQFLAKYPTQAVFSAASPAANSADWPLLQATVGIEGPDLYGVAVAVNQIFTAWMITAADIEHKRMYAKALVSAATTQDQINAALAVNWPTSLPSSVTVAVGAGSATISGKAPA